MWRVGLGSMNGVLAKRKVFADPMLAGDKGLREGVVVRQ